MVSCGHVNEFLLPNTPPRIFKTLPMRQLRLEKEGKLNRKGFFYQKSPYATRVPSHPMATMGGAGLHL